MSRLARLALVFVSAAVFPAVPTLPPAARAADPLTVVDQVGMLRVAQRDGRPALELTASDYDGSGSRSLDPARVVVHVPTSGLTTVPHDDFARDPGGEDPGPEDSFYAFLGPEGTPYFRTAADPADGAATGNVVLGLAGSEYADGARAPEIRLLSATGGRSYLYQDTPVRDDPEAEPYRALNWDLSRPAGVANIFSGVYAPDERLYAVGAFAAAGSYCLTMRPEVLRFADNATVRGAPVAMRVVVGDRSADQLAATAPCEQPTDPTDPDPPTGGTTVLGAGSHVDVAGVLRGGDPLSLVLRKTDAAGGGNEKLIPFDAAVVTVPDRARTTVPAPSAGVDTSFLGAAGSPTWRIPENYDRNLVWLGFGGELIKQRVTSSPVLRITGVTGADGGPPPGEVAVWNNGSVSGGAGPTFSTRQGLPQGAYLPVGSHGHRNWDFSAPGVYCLGMDLQLADAAGTEQRDTRQLTVVVGDEIDPATVTPCGRAGQPLPVGVPHRSPATAPAGVLQLTSSPDGSGTSVENRLTTSMTADGRLVTRIVRERPDGPGTAYDPADVVFRARQDRDANPYPQAGPVGRRLYTFHQYGDGGGDLLGIDTLGVEASQLRGRLSWAITGMRGPGRVALRDAFLNRQILLATPAAPTSATTLVPGRSENRFQLHLDTPGVYCVAMSWRGRRASDGATVGDTTTLTLVAGDRPATVTTCGRGQRPTAASSTPSRPTNPTSPGSGSTRPASGRSVLRFGHVDIRSDVTAAGLRVAVHDDHAEPAVDRDPAKVTFAVAPAARSSVPAAGAYRFLGRAGAPVWVLPQTQDDRLLWPGWNVGLSRGGATSVRWTLNSVRGPGRFALFESEAFGTPRVLLDGTRRSSFGYSAHGHGNWAFTADGVYCLDSTFTALPKGGSGKATLLVAVGALDATTVTPADCGRTAAQVRGLDAGRGSGPSGRAPGSDSGAVPGAPVSLRPVSRPVSAGDQSALQRERCLATPIVTTRPAPATVVADGHLDLGAAVRGAALVAELEDGRADPPISRDPAGVVLDVGVRARSRVPAGYGFLGRQGAPVWLIPQTQRTGVPWLGWNTQHPTLRAAAAGPVTFALTGVTGPGRVAVYTDDVFGGVRERVLGTAPGFPRATRVPLNVHAHANWAFTRPGTYRLALTQSVPLRDGSTRSATTTLTIAVARADPAASASGLRTVRYVGRTAGGESCRLSASQQARALASTGGDLIDALATGLGLVAVALVLLLAGRRRRRA